MNWRDSLPPAVRRKLRVERWCDGLRVVLSFALLVMIGARERGFITEDARLYYSCVAVAFGIIASVLLPALMED